MNIDVILTYNTYLNSTKIWAPGPADEKNIYRITISPKKYVRFCVNANACKLCCVEVLRPTHFNGIMLNAVRFPKHTSTGQALFSKRLFTSIVCILSPKMTALVSSVHVRIGKSGPALFSYPLHFAPATKRSDWTYCTVRSASFIAIPFTQAGYTYQTEFALAKKRPWSDWTYCTVCSASFLFTSCTQTWKIPTRIKKKRSRSSIHENPM